eukprot:TRINITY_DN2057_c0_g1_i1.p1 TRINITY_DN2057_c0_g1~~TRINITY_DN2057_c0_g1_i1.p1  ORF type:complete len:449 (+),score=108.35 TRINITY_DN2057_c0_g1_i1:41-1348(+)
MLSLARSSLARSASSGSSSLWSRSATPMTNNARSHKAATMLQKRFLNIHEYQAHALMKTYGISVPRGGLARTPEEAESVARGLNTEDLVIKAQVLSGGRGKGKFDNGFQGGVHIANSPVEARNLASRMLNHRLFTKQSGPDGKPCNEVFIVSRHFIRREAYFAILLDRESSRPVMIGSSQGGMDIEKVAAEQPEAIHKVFLDPNSDEVNVKDLEELSAKMGFPPRLTDNVVDQMTKLYKLFRETDATLVEINPLAETIDAQAMCLDAKLNFDTNAEFRQPEIFKLKDRRQLDIREVEAAEHDLNYIGLDGSIGCLVNGAGLAMATMDIIKLKGGSPANFLDIGGGANDKQVSEALRILTHDPNVRAILINIFGGIMRCVSCRIAASSSRIESSSRRCTRYPPTGSPCSYLHPNQINAHTPLALSHRMRARNNHQM